MRPRIVQVEPIVLFLMSLGQWIWGDKAQYLWCLGFEATTVVFAIILGIFTLNVIHEIKTALGINVLTV